MKDSRQIITYSIVFAYLVFVAVLLYRMMFTEAEITHLEAALGLLGGIGAWVGQIVERRTTQVSHERKNGMVSE